MIFIMYHMPNKIFSFYGELQQLLQYNCNILVLESNRTAISYLVCGVCRTGHNIFAERSTEMKSGNFFAIVIIYLIFQYTLDKEKQ